jgi:hypothetical protein
MSGSDDQANDELRNRELLAELGRWSQDVGKPVTVADRPVTVADDGLGAVAQAAATQDGSCRIAAALLTLALWTGGDKGDSPFFTREDVVDTYRAMLRDVKGADNG